MKRYKVTLKVWNEYEVEVEASSEDSAEETALDVYGCPDFDEMPLIGDVEVSSVVEIEEAPE
jgi:hypothetical protein